MTFPKSAQIKGGKRRAELAASQCVCPLCGSELNRQQRIELHMESELDVCGGTGGQVKFQRWGTEKQSQDGKLGGRGNTKAKRLAKVGNHGS